MNVSAANPDYAKTNRVAGRAQRVRSRLSRRKSVHRNEGSNYACNERNCQIVFVIGH
ncbi:hypothetical protein ALC57_05069 [Trachymyrmex cornetzi]|uniref:Uncharacterized protein n=1 Tax=Trachymyrmex cornetzi TaxID=471704 RepID=A0A151JBP2_9HYME|nr:hypothetical protein ALC57_05069 [Trachymyrmex cornetzi]